MSAWHRRSCARRWRGFSILEVLLAMVLSTALLAGLFSALTLFMRSFDSGRTNVEQAQLARALLRQISRDLRSAVVETAATRGGSEKPLALPSDFLPQAESTLSPAPELPPERTLVLSPVTATTATPHRAHRLTGTSDRLNICVRASGAAETLAALFATSELGTTSPSAADPSTASSHTPNGVLQVSYFCCDPADPERALVGDSSNPHDQFATMSADKAAAGATGFVRREAPLSEEPAESAAQPRAGIETTEISETSGTSALSASTSDASTSPGLQSATPRASEYASTSVLDPLHVVETLTPEIARVAFRYFDGSAWYSSWDSESDGGLPVAVDVAFWLAEPADEARRPRSAEERRDSSGATGDDNRAEPRSQRRETSRAEESSPEVETPYGETPPDYRLVVYLALAQPRADEAALPLSSPEELADPPLADPPAIEPSFVPSTSAPSRRLTRPSFSRPSANAPAGGTP